MKRILFLFAAMFPAGLLAQETAGPSLYLSSYRFNPGKKSSVSVRMNDGRVKINRLSVNGSGVGISRKKGNYILTFSKLAGGDAKWIDVAVSAETTAGVVKDTFRIVRDEFVHNKVIAHRGAWKNTGASENSVASLTNAISIGCEGSEFDVHMSSDSVLFIHHDPKINDVFIEKTTSEELSAMTLSNGEHLPTLAAYLEAGIHQNKTQLILEIKPSVISKERSLALTRKVIRMVERYRCQAWITYISFDYDICKEVLRLAPYARVSYLNGDKAPAELAAAGLFGLDYHYSVFEKNPSWLGDATRYGITTNAWTVNDEAMMDKLLAEKIDFITTNEPEMLLRKVAAKRQP